MSPLPAGWKKNFTDTAMTSENASFSAPDSFLYIKPDGKKVDGLVERRRREPGRQPFAVDHNAVTRVKRVQIKEADDLLGGRAEIGPPDRMQQDGDRNVVVVQT